MNYPLISEYVESIMNAEDNFNELSYLRPVLNEDGSPIMSSGNLAVVFKMTDGNKSYAVKCFIKDQEERTERYKLISDYLKSIESEYIVSVKYIENELFVDTKQTDVSEFPVLLMEWVEGQTLSSCLNNAYNTACSYWSTSWDGEYVYYELTRLLNNFLRMASWLLKQPFAHGDLKPDNIIINQNGTCVLIDYDGMYVPTMAGMQNVGMGTVNFRYPFNANSKFDAQIDNYAIALMALSIQVFVIDIRKVSDCVDYCVINENEVNKLDKILLLHDVQFISDNNFKELFALYLHTLAHNQLSSLYFDESISNILIPNDFDIYNTKASEEDLNHCWEDDHGVKYSLDGRRVLKASSQLKGKDYIIKEGTLIICDQAFQSMNLNSIRLPSSVISIGDRAFANNDNMVSCNIPSSVRYIYDNNPWGGCFNIKHMECHSPYYTLDNGILYTSDYYIVIGFIYWQSNVKIDMRTRKIAGNAFWSARCKYDEFIKTVDLSNVNNIGAASFLNCKSASIKISSKVERIGESSFEGCEKLNEIDLSNVKLICKKSFANCRGLKKVIFSSELLYIEDDAFRNCSLLSIVKVPDSVTYISESAFDGCNELNGFYVSLDNKSYKSIDGVLFNKSATRLIRYPINIGRKEYVIPSTVIEIADNAFYGCKDLEKVSCNNELFSFGKRAFMFCSNIKQCSLKTNYNAPADSIFNLGKFLFNIKESVDDSKKRGFNLIYKAADRNYTNAQIYMARIYKEGLYDGCVNNEQYIYWLRRAAEYGDTKAIYKLAIELLAGKNTNVNYEKAFLLLNKLMELDSNNIYKKWSYVPLALMYEEGLGLVKDTQKAFLLYKKGAILNDSNAEYNLGRCYENGIGTDTNLFKAQEFYSKAFKHEYPKAKKALELLDIKINEQYSNDHPF